jgi:DNA-directed RNA polymerase subunit RPC12/RpoP
MKPATARVLMIVLVSAAGISGVLVANGAPFNGRFLPGLFIVVFPVLLLAFLLPKILPVRCEKCGGRMSMRWLGPQSPARREPDLYAYICSKCGDRHVWEGPSDHSIGG